MIVSVTDRSSAWLWWTAGLIMAAGLALAFARDTTAASPPDEGDIRRLIDQLGSARYKDREEASQRLESLGAPAWYALCKASVCSTDLEICRRAKKLVQTIGKRLFVQVRVFGGQGGYWLNRVAFTPDGHRAIATGGAVIVYDLDSGKELYRVMELNFARRGLAISRDGRYFLTGHQHDPFARLGEVKSGKEVRVFKGHTAGIFAVALSPDDARAATGSQDGTVRLWDVNTGQALRIFKGPAGTIHSVAFAPDGRHILSGHAGPGSANLVCLWEADSGREIRRFAGHGNEVTAVTFLPDGRTFLSASLDGTLRQWDAKTGQELRRMEHRGGARDLAVTPDGHWALSAGFGDHLVRLWDLSDGNPIFAYEGHRGAVLGVAISRDGHHALSCDAQNTVCLWRLPDLEGRQAAEGQR